MSNQSGSRDDEQHKSKRQPRDERSSQLKNQQNVRRRRHQENVARSGVDIALEDYGAAIDLAALRRLNNKLNED